jgi:hypothetical protein
MFKSITLYKKKVQWYFQEIYYKDIYAKNIENEEILNIEFEEFIWYLLSMSLVFL